MTTIEYFGIDTKFGNGAELINSENFRAILEANPELSLVTVEEDLEGRKMFYKVELPLPEDNDDWVAVIDVDDRGSFMWILRDKLSAVTDPSPAFIEILKVMDTHSIENRQDRLFLTQYDDLDDDEDGLDEGDPEILAAEYDFITGRYIL